MLTRNDPRRELYPLYKEHILKALIINGSPHKNGSTTKVLSMLEEKIRKSYDVETVFAYDLAIKPCIGCTKCRPNNECVLPNDDGHVMGKKMTDADVVIIGSPCYWGNVPAPLKLIFDRNVVTFEHFLTGKPVPKLVGKKGVILVTTGSGKNQANLISQGKGTVQAIKTVLQSGGIKVTSSSIIYSAWNIDNEDKRVRKIINKISI
jgi:multimeric flavodoxin WrbA